MFNSIYLKKIFSSLMILAVIALSLDGIFFAFPKQALSVGPALTNVTNTPTSTQISASTSHKIDFTTYTTVPADGKILITFPAGFNIASAAFSAWSGFDGNKTVSVNGQVVAVTRTTDGTASTAGGKYITLSGITNTATAGTNYTVTVETQNSSSTTLDGPTTSFYFSICINACHTSTFHIPWVSTVSTSTKHTTKFTTGSVIPASGKIKLTFPSGFNIASASTTELNGSGSIFNLTQSIASQTITIVNASTTAMTAGNNYVVIDSITNHSTAGSAYYAIIETTNASDVNIEGPTSVRFTINDTGVGLASSPWPSRDGSLGKTHNTGVAGPIYPTMKWASNFGYTLSTSTLSWWYKGQISFWAIASNGAIYAEVKEAGNTARLIALDNSGNVQWSYPVTTPNLSAVSVAHDGSIYTAKDNTGLQGDIALNSDGSVKWLTGPEGSRYIITPNILPDGSIYFSGNSGNIWTPDGSPKAYINSYPGNGWNFNVAPAIGSDGTIYQGFHTNSLVAYNPDFIQKWSLSLPTGSQARSITLDTDGTIYFIDNGTTNKILYALNSDSSTKWQYTLPDIPADPYADASIAISDQSIYVACATKLYVFDKSGNLVLTKDGFNGSIPVISSNGMIYSQQNTTNYLQASDTSGNFKWSYKSAATAQYKNGLILPGYNQEIYTYDITNKKAVSFQPWTLSATITPVGYYEPGDTLTFTATTTMLATDPVTSEANKIQVYDATGAAILTTLTYSSTSGGNTIWTGTYQVPEGTTNGTYTATIEAGSVNVETDTTVHFASAPTNSNNKGITATVNYVVDTTAPVNFAPTANPSSWTTDTTPTITFSTTDALAGIDYYQVKIDSGNYATQTSPYTLPAQTDGTHTITVKAVDRAGNSREASAITVYIDTTAPTSSTLSVGTITVNSIIVQISGSQDANAGLHSTAPYYFQETTAPANTGWQAGTSWTHSTLSTNTQYTYQVKARDNTDTPNQSNFTTAQSKYTLANTPANLTATKQSNDNNKMNLTVDELPNAASGQSGYYFYRANDEANHNSGWIQTNTWQDANFTCNTHYTWSVKYRNGDGTETNTASLTSNSATNYPYSCGTAFVAPPATITGQVTTTPSQPATTIKYLPSSTDNRTNNNQSNANNQQTFTKVEIPAGATTGATTIMAEPQTASQISQTTANAPLPANQQIVSNLAIICQASSGGKTVKNFQKPITITFQYTAEDIKQYQENTLKIYYFNETSKQWIPLADSKVNTATNTIKATTSHLTLFAVMGLPKGATEEKEKPIKPESIKEPEKTNKEQSEEKPKEQSKQTSIQPETKEPAKSETYVFNRQMRYGAVGKDVVKLQNLLKTLGLFPKDIPSTGYFGAITLKAVNKYQKEAMKIKPCYCGVGPKTKEYLNSHPTEVNIEKYVFIKDLGLGSQGDEVKQLQNRLKQEQFFPHWIKSTGWFGSITEKAVKLFQKAHQLVEAGLVDQLTKQTLNSQ